MTPEMMEFLNARMNYDSKGNYWHAMSGRNWQLVVWEEGWSIYEDSYDMRLELSGPPSISDIEKVMELGRFQKETR